MRNYLWITNAVFKMVVVVTTLYVLSQFIKDYTITVIGFMGIGWVISEAYNEYRFYELSQGIR